MRACRISIITIRVSRIPLDLMDLKTGSTNCLAELRTYSHPGVDGIYMYVYIYISSSNEPEYIPHIPQILSTSGWL